MFKISSTVAGIATLALATLPMLALASGAQAAPAPVSVQVADIDINSASGAQAFQQRVDTAAREFCRDTTRTERGLRSLRDNRNCKVAVREEAAEKAAAHNEAKMAKAKAATLASR